ncbi:PHB depolymerase family esterase [Halioxenophilus sp. WMMB6]|uniref:extracellular catalytic domain type 1 short-chain-length polyhydroxyalkanoate depolymerase n=1 Tax=Halioxenophilus sp. WMMB6 TaxID=3073815 RepID=UPI00295F4011|nr:PHB depolymerase family esterase [Halioxenophilus sp. WMMB6]
MTLISSTKQAVKQLLTRIGVQPAALLRSPLASPYAPRPVTETGEWPAFEPATEAPEPHPSQHLDLRLKARDYRGSKDRLYRVFVPSGYKPSRAVPLVMVLHGCQQNHLDIEKISNFSALAEREGFIVVYPYITKYGGIRGKNCWGWWMPSQTRAGAGEVEDLWQIVEEVKSQFHIDPKRIHVAGLSSGAGMAVALMVTHGQGLASGASVAGVAYGESAHAVNFFRPLSPHYRSVPTLVRTMEDQMGSGKFKVPLLVIHSRDDSVVNIKAAKNLRDSWAQCFDIALHKKSGMRSGETGNSRWHHTRYRSAKRRSELETLWLEGPDHGWYGGRPGAFSYPNAFNISEFMWRFFKSHDNEAPS